MNELDAGMLYAARPLKVVEEEAGEAGGASSRRFKARLGLFWGSCPMGRKWSFYCIRG